MSGLAASDGVSGSDSPNHVLHPQQPPSPGLHHDLGVLHLHHPFKLKRDTSLYKPFRAEYKKGHTPGLKALAEKYLGEVIQTGEHSSVEEVRYLPRNIPLSCSAQWIDPEPDLITCVGRNEALQHVQK